MNLHLIIEQHVIFKCIYSSLAPPLNEVVDKIESTDRKSLYVHIFVLIELVRINYILKARNILNDYPNPNDKKI